jgi:hypothetical protein
MVASLTTGISTGFAEALADDGKLSARGTPILGGVVCGLMTIAGGVGHTLFAIAFIQWRYMEMPLFSAASKVCSATAWFSQWVCSLEVADVQYHKLMLLLHVRGRRRDYVEASQAERIGRRRRKALGMQP